MARPGSKTAYKGKEVGYLVGLPVGTGQHRAEMGLGQQLCATLTKLAGASPSQGEPQTSPRAKSEVSRTQSLIYPLFPQDIILKLLLQDIPNNNPLLLQKEDCVNYWLHTPVI